MAKGGWSCELFATVSKDVRLASNGMREQAADINALFGFRLECIERMGDQQGLLAWSRLNSLFAWLPLAALVEDRIICMHGGELNSRSAIVSTCFLVHANACTDCATCNWVR